MWLSLSILGLCSAVL